MGLVGVSKFCCFDSSPAAFNNSSKAILLLEGYLFKTWCGLCVIFPAGTKKKRKNETNSRDRLVPALHLRGRGSSARGVKLHDA